jgi:BirA family biotin operon repressor/biotin-[acetyl-CoA-carboxylase] ligase
MNLRTLQDALADLPINEIHFFHSIGSTNDVAAAWLANGAPDSALVVSDEQTAGRGRSGRQWYTPPQAALAFSLVLRFDEVSNIGGHLARLAGLGGLAVCDALYMDYKLPAQIKWPNDVLVGRRKIAGVLVEARWQGQHLEGFILGIGVNVLSQSTTPPAELAFPATCVELEAGKSIDRTTLLHAILLHLLKRRRSLGSDQFMQSWQQYLAFKDEPVQVIYPERVVEGLLSGLNDDGSLRLVTADGELESIYAGEVRLRPKPG